MTVGLLGGHVDDIAAEDRMRTAQEEGDRLLTRGHQHDRGVPTDELCDANPFLGGGSHSDHQRGP